MAANPEQLHVDFKTEEGKKKMCDLIFYTADVKTWREAVCQHYKHVSIEGIGKGCQLKVCHDENLDTEDPALTITYYPSTGKVMVQANEENLTSFE